MDFASSISFDLCDEEGNQVPERKMPSLLSLPVMPLEKVLSSSSSINHTSKDQAKIKRLLEDMKTITKNPNPDYQAFPCESDITFWRIIMNGPSSSPYEKGTWLIYVKFPD